MISVVTAYFNRRKLFVRTLDSLVQYVGKVNFELVVVDDGSREEERLEDLEMKYDFLRVVRIESQNKWYSNPCIPFNVGFEKARGEMIVLQNPENYHFSNILEFVQNNLIENTYLSFGCFSLNQDVTDNEELFFDRANILTLIGKSNYPVADDGELGWYNHSKYRPNSYHFCTAIMRKDLIDLGGFDSRYALGYGYDDDDLIYRIRLKGMKVRFVDHLFVLHQNHYVKSNIINEEVQQLRRQMSDRNKLIFETITLPSSVYRANYLAIGTEKPSSSNSVLENYISKLVKAIRLIIR